MLYAWNRCCPHHRSPIISVGAWFPDPARVRRRWAGGRDAPQFLTWCVLSREQPAAEPRRPRRAGATNSTTPVVWYSSNAVTPRCRARGAACPARFAPAAARLAAGGGRTARRAAASDAAHCAALCLGAAGRACVAFEFKLAGGVCVTTAELAFNRSAPLAGGAGGVVGCVRSAPGSGADGTAVADARANKKQVARQCASRAAWAYHTDSDAVRRAMAALSQGHDFASRDVGAPPASAPPSPRPRP